MMDHEERGLRRKTSKPMKGLVAIIPLFCSVCLSICLSVSLPVAPVGHTPSRAALHQSPHRHSFFFFFAFAFCYSSSQRPIVLTSPRPANCSSHSTTPTQTASPHQQSWYTSHDYHSYPILQQCCHASLPTLPSSCSRAMRTHPSDIASSLHVPVSTHPKLPTPPSREQVVWSHGSFRNNLHRCWDTAEIDVFFLYCLLTPPTSFGGILCVCMLWQAETFWSSCVHKIMHSVLFLAPKSSPTQRPSGKHWIRMLVVDTQFE